MAAAHGGWPCCPRRSPGKGAGNEPAGARWSGPGRLSRHFPRHGGPGRAGRSSPAGPLRQTAQGLAAPCFLASLRGRRPRGGGCPAHRRRYCLRPRCLPVLVGRWNASPRRAAEAFAQGRPARQESRTAAEARSLGFRPLRWTTGRGRSGMSSGQRRRRRPGRCPGGARMGRRGRRLDRERLRRQRSMDLQPERQSTGAIDADLEVRSRWRHVPVHAGGLRPQAECAGRQRIPGLPCTFCRTSGDRHRPGLAGRHGGPVGEAG